MQNGENKRPASLLAKASISFNSLNTPAKVFPEMHKIGVYINLIAKKVNTTGDSYLEEMKEL